MRERLEVRHANRRRMKQELVFVRRMLNESFAQLGYYTEIDEDEFAYQVAGLGFLIDERIALYLFKAGEPIAFVLCVPDISGFVRMVNGNLNALNQVRLLLTRGRYRSEAIGVIQGTVPSEQGKGYLRLLTRELIRNLRSAGLPHPARDIHRARERRVVRVHGPPGTSRARRHVLRPRRHVSDLRDLRRLETQFFRAPSAHNTQPWILEYGPDRVELSLRSGACAPGGRPDAPGSAPVARRAGGGGAHHGLVGRCRGRVRARLRGRNHGGSGRSAEPASPYATPFTPDDLARRQTSRAEYTPGRLTDEELADARSQLAGDAELHELPTRDLVALDVAAELHLYDSPAIVEELRSWLRLERRHPRYALDGLSYECLGLTPVEATTAALLLRQPVFRFVHTASTAPKLHRRDDLAARARRERARARRCRADAGARARPRAILAACLAGARPARPLHASAEPDPRLRGDGASSSRSGSAHAAGNRLLSVFRAGRSEPPPRSSRRPAGLEA